MSPGTCLARGRRGTDGAGAASHVLGRPGVASYDPSSKVGALGRHLHGRGAAIGALHAAGQALAACPQHTLLSPSLFLAWPGTNMCPAHSSCLSAYPCMARDGHATVDILEVLRSLHARWLSRAQTLGHSRAANAPAALTLAAMHAQNTADSVTIVSMLPTPNPVAGEQPGSSRQAPDPMSAGLGVQGALWEGGKGTPRQSSRSSRECRVSRLPLCMRWKEAAPCCITRRCRVPDPPAGPQKACPMAHAACSHCITCAGHARWVCMGGSGSGLRSALRRLCADACSRCRPVQGRMPGRSAASLGCTGSPSLPACFQEPASRYVWVCPCCPQVCECRCQAVLWCCKQPCRLTAPHRSCSCGFKQKQDS